MRRREAFLRRGPLLVGDPRDKDERRSYDLIQALATVLGSSGRCEEAMTLRRGQDGASRPPAPAIVSFASWSLTGGGQPASDGTSYGPADHSLRYSVLA